MIVVTGYVCSRRDEAFLGWIFGCIVFFLCLGSAGALFVGCWAVARGLVLQCGLYTYASGSLGNV